VIAVVAMSIGACLGFACCCLIVVGADADDGGGRWPFGIFVETHTAA
jgi:hypothetical protein